MDQSPLSPIAAFSSRVACEPVICYSLSAGISRLCEAITVLATRCVDGITANVELLRQKVESSIGLVTALNPYIGYAAATDVAKDAMASGRGIAELVLERGLLPPEKLRAILRPEVLANVPPTARSS